LAVVAMRLIGSVAPTTLDVLKRHLIVQISTIQNMLKHALTVQIGRILMSKVEKLKKMENFKKLRKMTGGCLTEIHLIEIVFFHLIESFNNESFIFYHLIELFHMFSVDRKFY
jgi:hypothetical protein